MPRLCCHAGFVDRHLRFRSRQSGGAHSGAWRNLRGRWHRRKSSAEIEERAFRRRRPPQRKDGRLSRHDSHSSRVERRLPPVRRRLCCLEKSLKEIESQVSHRQLRKGSRSNSSRKGSEFKFVEGGRGFLP